MFRSKQPDLSKTDTLVGEGTTFEGKIVSQASIRIEGQVVGDIQCTGDLTIGEQAVIRSNIQARNVTIAGKVEGDVTATNKLAITASGRLLGNAASSSFTIEEGGTFSGMSRMESPASDRDKKKTSERTDGVAL